MADSRFRFKPDFIFLKKLSTDGSAKVKYFSFLGSDVAIQTT